MLFQWDMGGLTPEHIVATFLAGQKLGPELRSYSLFLFEGTVREAESLDRLLREGSNNGDSGTRDSFRQARELGEGMVLGVLEAQGVPIRATS